MKKEPLNSEDKLKIGKKNRLIVGIGVIIFLLTFLIWIAVKHMLNQDWREDSAYLLAPISIVFIVWVIFFLDRLLSYKLTTEGEIESKGKRNGPEYDYYVLKIKSRKKEIEVPKEKYEKFEIGQKVRIEQTASTKSILLIKEL